MYIHLINAQKLWKYFIFTLRPSTVSNIMKLSHFSLLPTLQMNHAEDKVQSSFFVICRSLVKKRKEKVKFSLTWWTPPHFTSSITFNNVIRIETFIRSIYVLNMLLLCFACFVLSCLKTIRLAPLTCVVTLIFFFFYAQVWILRP